MNFEQWLWQTWKSLDERSPEEVVREYTQEEVRVVMAAAVQTLIDELARGGGLAVAGFGKLGIAARKPRYVVSNICGGKVYKVGARRTVQFTPSKKLIELVNQHTSASGGISE